MERRGPIERVQHRYPTQQLSTLFGVRHRRSDFSTETSPVGFVFRFKILLVPNGATLNRFHGDGAPLKIVVGQ
jgi:hypothetical protein